MGRFLLAFVHCTATTCGRGEETFSLSEKWNDRFVNDEEKNVKKKRLFW